MVCMFFFLSLKRKGHTLQPRAFFAGREEEYDGMFVEINLPASHESFCAF